VTGKLLTDFCALYTGYRKNNLTLVFTESKKNMQYFGPGSTDYMHGTGI